MAAIGAHADYVAKRVAAVNVRKVVLSILALLPILLGICVRLPIRLVVWTGAWVWFAFLEGWNMAGPKDQRT